MTYYFAVPLLTIQNITFTLGVLGIIFSVYKSLTQPQINDDKRTALLAQQVDATNQAVASRFKDMQDSFQQLLLQSNNHIHTVDTKVENLSKNVSDLTVQVTRLSTIIDERIPKKSQ